MTLRKFSSNMCVCSRVYDKLYANHGERKIFLVYHECVDVMRKKNIILQETFELIKLKMDEFVKQNKKKS